MRKIPTLFLRDEKDRRYVTDEVTPGLRHPEREGCLMNVQKWGQVVNVSHEELLAIGAITPTPEEQAEMDARHESYLKERAEVAVLVRGAIPQLDAITNQPARALLDLHARNSDGGYTRWTCEGCDYEGMESEPPDWPCRTVRLISEQHEITWPEWRMVERPYDGSLDLTPRAQKDPAHKGPGE